MARRSQLAFAQAGLTNAPTISADGSYPAAPGWADWPGGQGALYVIGTFGAGTAKLQTQAPDGVTWLDLGTGVSFLAPGVGGFTAPAGRLRVNVAGSTAPSLQAWAVGIPTNNGG